MALLLLPLEAAASGSTPSRQRGSRGICSLACLARRRRSQPPPALLLPLLPRAAAAPLPLLLRLPLLRLDHPLLLEAGARPRRPRRLLPRRQSQLAEALRARMRAARGGRPRRPRRRLRLRRNPPEQLEEAEGRLLPHLLLRLLLLGANLALSEELPLLLLRPRRRKGPLAPADVSPERRRLRRRRPAASPPPTPPSPLPSPRPTRPAASSNPCTGTRSGPRPRGPCGRERRSAPRRSWSRRQTAPRRQEKRGAGGRRRTPTERARARHPKTRKQRKQKKETRLVLPWNWTWQRSRPSSA